MPKDNPDAYEVIPPKKAIPKKPKPVKKPPLKLQPFRESDTAIKLKELLKKRREKVKSKK